MDNKIQKYQRDFTLIKDWDKSYLKQTAVNHFTTVKETIHNPNDCETHTNWQDRNDCSCILPFVLKQNNGKVAFTNFNYADYVGVDIDTTKLTDSWDLAKITEYVKNLGFTAHAFYSLTQNHYKLLVAINRTYNINEYRTLRDTINNILPFADTGYKGHQTFIKGYINQITSGKLVPTPTNLSSPKFTKANKTYKKYAKANKSLKNGKIMPDYSCFIMLINNVIKGADTSEKYGLKKYGKIEYIKYNKNNNTFNLFVEGEQKSKGSFFFSPGKSIKIYKGNRSWMPQHFFNDEDDNIEFYKIMRTLQNINNRFLILAGKKKCLNDYDNAITDIYNHKIAMRRRLTSCGVKRYTKRINNKRQVYFMYNDNNTKYYEKNINDVKKLFYKIKDKLIEKVSMLSIRRFTTHISRMIISLNLNNSTYKRTLAQKNQKSQTSSNPSLHSP